MGSPYRDVCVVRMLCTFFIAPLQLEFVNFSLLRFCCAVVLDGKYGPTDLKLTNLNKRKVSKRSQLWKNSPTAKEIDKCSRNLMGSVELVAGV
jgi:hypothetical protein